jgi:hypothetical protein
MCLIIYKKIYATKNFCFLIIGVICYKCSSKFEFTSLGYLIRQPVYFIVMPLLYYQTLNRIQIFLVSVFQVNQVIDVAPEIMFQPQMQIKSLLDFHRLLNFILTLATNKTTVPYSISQLLLLIINSFALCKYHTNK